MRISCLDTQTIRLTRDALNAHCSDWTAHFLPEFRAPPPPLGIDGNSWPHIAEHVARAERVSQDIRERGFEAAIGRFGGSDHAIEHATLIAAAAQMEKVSVDMLAGLLTCEIDELVAYGTFLELLHHVGNHDRKAAIGVYERFYAACLRRGSDQALWIERVRMVRDGLASFYIRCGRLDAGHELFMECHQEEQDSLMGALAASRAFLSGGSVSHALMWLGMGADRADALGRSDTADTLRRKQESLRKRQS